MHNSAKTFADNVKRELVENEIKGQKPASAADLARELKRPPQYVSKMLQGRGLTLKTLDRVAKILGVSPASLLGERRATSGPEALIERLDALPDEELQRVLAQLKKSRG